MNEQELYAVAETIAPMDVEGQAAHIASLGDTISAEEQAAVQKLVEDVQAQAADTIEEGVAEIACDPSADDGLITTA